ncbi:MAG: transglycosylase SLT domain-containing protein [Proteobacteria bacterium]|nr:transglycosylase SLT domain-containing protein [Pseudomonadota bacterium]
MKVIRRLLPTTLVAVIAITLLAGCEPVPNTRPNTSESGPVSVPVPLPESPPITITDLPPEDRGPLTAPSNAPLPPEGDVLTSGQVLDRLRARLSQPSCIVGPNNTRWRHKYAGYPRHFADQIQAVLPRMLVVMDALESHHLPAEFAVIPIVESWYRMDVRSFGGAVGMWQFLAETARNNGATVNRDYDGRLSMADGTDAAMSYLGNLQSMFHDWRLASMAYNSGEFRLAKTMSPAELAERGAGPGMRYKRPWGLAFGTYEYVSKMRALVCLLDQPTRQGIPLDPTVPVTHWVRYTVPDGINSLDELAARLGTDAEELKAFNFAYRDGRLYADTPRVVMVPAATRPRWASVGGAETTPSSVTAPTATAAPATTTANMATAASTQGSSPPISPSTTTTPTTGTQHQILLPPMPAASAKVPALVVASPVAVKQPPPTPRPMPTKSLPVAAHPEATDSAVTQPTAPSMTQPAVAHPSVADSTAKAQPTLPSLQPAIAQPRAADSTVPQKTGSSPKQSITVYPTTVDTVVPPQPTPPSSQSVSTPMPALGSFHPPIPAGIPASSESTQTAPPASSSSNNTSAPAPVTPSQQAGQPTHSAPTSVPAQAVATTPTPAPKPVATYKVQFGDTLDAIAARFHVTTTDLRAWNHLAPDAILDVDQVLKLEP